VTAVFLIVLCTAALLPLAGGGALAQGGSQRRVTTVETIRQYSGYYHLQPVLVRGTFTERSGQLVLQAGMFEMDLLNPEQARGGAVEVRAVVIDVGRIERDHPRVRTYVDRRGNREWPRPGAEVVLDISSVVDADPFQSASIRALALEPWNYEGRRVTVTGSFRGRNLFGDLPAAPGDGRYDFVVAGAEGAVWVTGMRPRGRGFDLDVQRRLDSNRWLEVTGLVSRQRGLTVVEAAQLTLAEAPKTVPPPPEPVSKPVEIEPARVVFSVPTANETDVSPAAPVRVQFSKGLREATLLGRIRATYADAPDGGTGLKFALGYDPALRAVQISFAQPLEPFRSVRIELLPGILAFDGAPVVPWTLAFTAGSR
jgi:hypothetical protein